MCTKCEIIKSPSEFFVKDGSAGRLHTQCKACYKIHRRTYQDAHYAKYKEAYKLRAKIRRTDIKKNLQMHMLDYLTDKYCIVCGEDDKRTLEFDHVDPSQKSFGIAKGITDGKGWKIILDEIGKCRILCANCHKKHTSSQNRWYKQPSK